MSNYLFSFFQSRFPTDLGKPFLTLPSGGSLSYADLIDRTGRLANLFRSLGVKRGDRLAVQTEKSADALLVYLAAVRAGAVYLPLNPAYTVGEVRYFLGDAAPVLFICRPEDENGMRELAQQVGVPNLLLLGASGEGDLLSLAAGQPSGFEDVPRGEGHLAAILYTSGTTGRSKGAMLTHGNLQSNAETLRKYWRFTSEDRLLHALPIFHTHGLFVATNSILAAGASMTFLPRFDAKELIRHLPNATVLMGVPTFYSRLLAEEGFTRELVSHMRLFVSGSAPLSAETHKAFSARTGHAILERYGMTETNMNTSNPYDGERVPGSVGFPLPGVELRIADSENGALIDDGIGVIEVRGPNVFKGYWQMPEKTAEDFRADGFFITGDLGHIDERGYVFIDGRAKDLIISGGFNVYPAEVEAAIDAIPGIAESAVIGVPYADMGEAVVAIVQARDPALDETKVLQALSDQLARYKQPRRVLFLPELPRNSMGKIQKKLLREENAGLFG
ncbi:MAG TPA: malonyl-CoA synthase [Rhizorhapis sp.]|nr:malonyl-CoA synthase [Rhizorhapis sp.]